MESERTPETFESKQSTWTTVTPLSKYLALALFVAMPFVGGWIGYHYAPVKVVEVEKVVVKDSPDEEVVDMSTQNSESNNQTEWITFENDELGISFEYPAYLGEASVEVYENQTDEDCPFMMTYLPQGMISIRDASIIFSNNRNLSGQGDARNPSYMEFNIDFVKRVGGIFDTCGSSDGIKELVDAMIDSPATYDVEKYNYPADNVLAFKSDVVTSINTGATKLYSFFVEGNSQYSFIQPSVSFIPSYGTEQSQLIDELSRVLPSLETDETHSIIYFIKETEEAEEVRAYFDDFELMAQSVRLLE